jgi:hypothetical protein
MTERPAGDSPDDAAGELHLRCATDRRGVESLFLELRRRARARGLDIEMVKTERCAAPEPRDTTRQAADP